MTATNDTEQIKRDKFNQILRSLDLVLMNNIPEVDPSVWDNWLDKSPMNSCEIENGFCHTHELEVNDNLDECDYAEPIEVYQWFACSSDSADYLKRHNQYVTYSDLLDTHFLAITHFGTAWSYTGMVDDFVTE